MLSCGRRGDTHYSVGLVLSCGRRGDNHYSVGLVLSCGRRGEEIIIIVSVSC